MFSLPISLSRCQLLTDILGSPDLYVMLIEMDVYTLAKKVCTIAIKCNNALSFFLFSPFLSYSHPLQWLFLTLNSDWTGSSEKLLGDAEDYFKYKGACP